MNCNFNGQVPVKKVALKQAMKKRKKNENILCAIIALMKELDRNGLEFIKQDAEKRISRHYSETSTQMTSIPPKSSRTSQDTRINQKKRGLWNR